VNLCFTSSPKKKRLILESDDQNKVTDLIVTSCRVLEIIENWQEYLDIPLWCVGDVTAHEAKLKGFKTIHCANRSAQDLLEMIVKETGQKKEQYYFRHVCGDTLHLDLSEALSRLGYRADKDVVYNTQPSKELTKKFIGLWTKGSFGVAPFFSQRTTEIFVNLIRKHKLQKYCASVQALAHSEAVLKKLQELQWAGIDLVPDLGEEKIREAHEQVIQHKTLSTIQGKPSVGSSNKSPFVKFVGRLLGVLFTVVLTLAIGWFFLLPRQIDLLRTSLHDQQQSQKQEIISQLKFQLEQEFKDQSKRGLQEQKMALQKELSRLEVKIDRLENRYPQVDPHLIDNREQYQRKSLETFSQERSEDLVNLMTYQKISSCLEHLKKSVLSQEEQDFLKDQGLNDKKAEDVLSFPQLTTELEALDFSVYTEDTSLSGKILSVLKEVLGIQIRQKKQLSIKQTILTDLSQFQFSFLDTLNTKEILLPAPLEKELTPWVEKAKRTHGVMDKILLEQQKIQKQLVVKHQEIPSVENTPSSASETHDMPQGNN